MKSMVSIGVAWLIACTSLLASSTLSVDLSARARGADGVVVASVDRVTATYERNKYGDELIVTHAELVVGEVLKGSSVMSGQHLVVDVEGGTVGDVTLRVSDLPRVSAGERAVFYLHRESNGRLTPYLRGQGILKLDAQNRILGSTLSLGDVRSTVQGR
jgi:hypothetical protein